MLKGNINCENVGRYLIKYINFDLVKKDTKRMAIHLRNCPKCMEKYNELQKKKKDMKKKLKEIEKKIEMENYLSLYIDNCLSIGEILVVERMIKGNDEYKKTFKIYKKIQEVLNKEKNKIKENTECRFSRKIIAKIKLKKRKRKDSIFGLFQLLRHGLQEF